MTPGVRSALLLALAAALSAALLSLAAHWTREPIAAARERARLAPLLALVPGADAPDQLSLHPLPVPPQFLAGLGLNEPEPAYQVRRGDAVLAVIVPTISDQGYGGRIRLLVGIDPAGNIAAVAVVEQRETPGIGDRILAAKSDWIRVFTGRSRNDPPPTRWQVRSDGGAFDQITGATISSRAVVRQVRRALDYFHEDRRRLLAPPPAAGNPPP